MKRKLRTTDAHESKKEERRAAADYSQPSGKSDVTAQRSDNHLGAIVQRQIQDKANRSQGTKRALQRQALADNHTSGNPSKTHLNSRPFEASTTIQRRINVNGDLYERNITPLKSWGFSAHETTAYNIINDAAQLEVTFASLDHMKVFIRRVAPYLSFFRTEFSQLTGTLTEDQVITAMAQQSDINRQGHGLARHGPQMSMSQLRDRLTTGYIGTTFAPAGEQGFATGFVSHEAFLVSQKAALDQIQMAYNTTVHDLQPLINTLKTRIGEQDGLEGGLLGNKKREIKAAKEAILKFVDNHHLKDPYHTPINMFPIRLVRSVYDSIGTLNHNQAHQVDGLIKFLKKYKIVLQNPEQIGRGLRVREDQRSHPIGHIRNPAFPVDGKQEPIWVASQLQHMGGIHNTSTTVNPPGSQFSFSAHISTWQVPQHFPDNGAVGWRS